MPTNVGSQSLTVNHNSSQQITQFVSPSQFKDNIQ